MARPDRMVPWSPDVLLIGSEEFLREINPYNDRALANNFDYEFLDSLGRDVVKRTHSALIIMGAKVPKRSH